MKLFCTNLVKKYGKRTVVKGVSIEVEQGEIVGLLGPNGAGKTTSFYMITGLIKPNAGRIFLGEEEITGLPMYKRAQKGVGYLAQEASVFRTMTVENNILSVMEMAGFDKEYRLQRLETLIEEFGLQKVRKSQGVQLSGGERRRCEIARALAINPKFILLDEPFAGVDPIAVEDIQHIIAKLKTMNIGVIITDHNVHETLAITDRAYLLYEGSILESGTAQQLADNPEVRKKYLGQNFELRKAVLVPSPVRPRALALASACSRALASAPSRPRQRLPKCQCPLQCQCLTHPCIRTCSVSSPAGTTLIQSAGFPFLVVSADRPPRTADRPLPISLSRLLFEPGRSVHTVSISWIERPEKNGYVALFGRSIYEKANP